MNHHLFRFREDERGSTVAEFAMAAMIFFILIFGVIEFARLLYTHNALNDAARRGARYAVLHANVGSADDPDPIECVKNVVVYGEKNIDAACEPTGPPLVSGLGTGNVTVTYEGADLDNDPDTPQTSYGMNLGTATVTIEDYEFSINVPVFGRTITMPTYTTTLTAESAGTEPDDI